MTDEQAVKAAAVTQGGGMNLTALPKEVEAWLKTVSPELMDGYQQIQGALGHPLTQFSVVLVRDPAFRGAVSEIHQNFNKSTFLGYEFAWILLIWIFRAWRLTKVSTWLTRIWVQAWVSVVFWIGFLFVVPWLLWGKSYQTVLSTVIRSLIHQFWT